MTTRTLSLAGFATALPGPDNVANLNVGVVTATAFTVDGNVGIGTDNPTEKLDIIGDVAIRDTAPALYFDETDTNTTAKLIVSSGDLYVQAGAAGSGPATSSGDIRFTGYNATDVNVFQVRSGGSYRDIWHSGNAGTGSGLDADTVDGIEASSFLRSDAADTTTGNITISKSLPKLILDSPNTGDNWTDQGAQISLGESGDGGSAALHLTYVGNGYGYIGMGAIPSTGIPPFSAIRFKYNADELYFYSNPSIAGSTNWHSGNDGAGSGLDADTLDGQQPSVTVVGNSIVQRHSSGYIYANYFNTTPNDVTSGVTKVCVETGNDGFIRHGTQAAIQEFIGAGSGNGLDADTVDGIEASSFLRSDAADVSTGNIAFNGTLATFDPPGGGGGTDTATDVAIAFESGHRIAGWNNGYIRTLFEWNAASDIEIGQSGTSLIGGINLLPGSSGSAKVNGNRILTVADEGTGGLDADTVDGIEASSFLRSDAADTASGVITFDDDVSVADKIIHTGDTNTAIRFPAADTFTVETAGVERLRINSDGCVTKPTNPCLKTLSGDTYASTANLHTSPAVSVLQAGTDINIGDTGWTTSGTNAYSFVCPVTGIYAVHAHVSLGNISENVRTIWSMAYTLGGGNFPLANYVEVIDVVLDDYMNYSYYEDWYFTAGTRVAMGKNATGSQPGYGFHWGIRLAQ